MTQNKVKAALDKIRDICVESPSPHEQETIHQCLKIVDALLQEGEAELDGCPFCGEEPEHSTYYDGEDECYNIECVNSQCELKGVSVSGLMGFEEEGYDIWNTRHSPATALINEFKEGAG